MTLRSRFFRDLPKDAHSFTSLPFQAVPGAMSTKRTVLLTDLIEMEIVVERYHRLLQLLDAVGMAEDSLLDAAGQAVFGDI